MPDDRRFAGYPTALIHDAPDGKPIKELLWGDHLRLTGPAVDGWQPVFSRKVAGFMRIDDFSEERLLEIVFVDIGQGDGALVVTPDDEHLLVDAGEEDNLHRFLRWRYGGFKKPFDFRAAVITHSDADHYGGFHEIFGDPNIRVDVLHHNGLVERTGKDLLGPRVGGFCTQVVETKDQLTALLAPPAARGRKKYPNLLWNFLQSGRLKDAKALSSDDRHLPGFAPGMTTSGLSIEVLGPVRDRAADGSPTLKWFGDDGKTKNGHSVILKLTYGDITVLLGGDLNTPAENHLLSKHTGKASPPSEADREALLRAARSVFRSDIAKACHHGSADFTDLFIQAVDPLVTVISSGDDEPHAHPRADALGAIGRWGRGARPLVFSTELARSGKDRMQHPQVFKRDLIAANAALAAAAPGPARDAAQKAVDRLMEQIDRSVAVYGAINLRSDGRRVVMAQMIEASKPTKKWDLYALEPDENGVLRYRSKFS